MAALVRQPGVVCVGEGNIGSQFGPLYARGARSGLFVAVDYQTYEASNLTGQHILPEHVGRAKARVAAEMVQTINPALAVRYHVAPIDQVPLDVLRADLILSSPDNPDARRTITTRAWRVGTPVLDLAVDAANGLVRLNLYVPGDRSPCIVCAWSDAEHANASGRYSCAGEPVAGAVAPSAAPAALGALAASLGCLHARRVLDGDLSLADHQLMLDVHHHRQYLARLPFNPSCRLDHKTWHIENIQASPDRLSLREAFGLLGSCSAADAAPVSLSHDTLAFVRRLRCTGCGASGEPLLELSGRLPQPPCARCGARRVATGFDRDPVLVRAEIAEQWLGRNLAQLGFLCGDVFTVARRLSTRHFQLGVTHE